MSKLRIGVLEWASCGGLDGSGDLQASIRSEGWAMCRAALLSLARAGHQAVAAVEPALLDDPLLDEQDFKRVHLVSIAGWPPAAVWKQTYADCDATLVIAPEIDGILADLLQWCEAHGLPTCNAHDAFLSNSSDKRATAIHLRRRPHSVPHPQTRLLSRATPDWIAYIAAKVFTGSHDDPTWVIKQRTGAGCDGIQRGSAAMIQQQRVRAEPAFDVSDWIVQPWLAGRAYSRAAIFERQGVAHWLPVTRQRLSVDRSLHYQGGVVEPDLSLQIPGLDEVLTRASRALGPGALGWVGFDFLYNPDDPREPVTVIEINPRLTTSFVGLCAAGACDLAGAIVSACHGKTFQLPTRWQRVEFTASGEIVSDESVPEPSD